MITKDMAEMWQDTYSIKITFKNLTGDKFNYISNIFEMITANETFSINLRQHLPEEVKAGKVEDKLVFGFGENIYRTGKFEKEGDNYRFIFPEGIDNSISHVFINFIEKVILASEHNFEDGTVILDSYSYYPEDYDINSYLNKEGILEYNGW